MTAEWLRRGRTGENPAKDMTGWLHPDGYLAPAPRPGRPDWAGLGADCRDEDVLPEAPAQTAAPRLPLRSSELAAIPVSRPLRSPVAVSAAG